MKTCAKCQKSFPLEKARLDKHWNQSSCEAAYVSCPYCNERLEGVHFDSVDLVRHLTLKNILLAAVYIALTVTGLATSSLNYVAPAMIAAFGLWLSRTSRLRDHRIAGWVLMLSSAVIFYVINFYA